MARVFSRTELAVRWVRGSAFRDTVVTKSMTGEPVLAEAAWSIIVPQVDEMVRNLNGDAKALRDTVP